MSILRLHFIDFKIPIGICNVGETRNGTQSERYKMIVIIIGVCKVLVTKRYLKKI